MARKKSTERALIECERRKWTAGLVERSVPTGGNQFIRTTIDFLGFADILALDGEDGVFGVQACTTDVASHIEKMTHDPKVAPNVARWLARGNRLAIWAFRRLKVKRGGVAVRWTLREIRAELVDGAVTWREVAEAAAQELGG